MLEWINTYSTQIDLFLSAATAVVWIVYLQLFLITFLRQTRSEILISIGAGHGTRARCFVSNLGMEPIYLSDIVLCLRGADGETRAFVTEREELRPEDLSRPAEGTNQGPLKSGESADIGSFDNLVARAQAINRDVALANYQEMEVTVVAQAASNASLIAARRAFRIVEAEGTEGNLRVRPVGLKTRQIRSYFARRRLHRELEANL